MSSPNLGFSVSARARAGVEDIVLQSLLLWGEEQMLIYEQAHSRISNRFPAWDGRETTLPGDVDVSRSNST